MLVILLALSVVLLTGDISEKMPTEKVFQALESFKAIGVTGVEFTGGGEPSIHPHFKEIVRYAKDLGFSLGICTNAARFGMDRPIKERYSRTI